MKRLLWVIVTALVLVAVVTGCDGMWRYDARLVAADSLMHDHPDSALALVQAIEPGSLTRERDRAYRDLLLTQGRYRSYVTATSDSDINRALDYYRRHDGEREKLTRAYIYKGAVMEELGLPDTAMTYYKYAEATAAPDDYFNLGYIKMQMGALYCNYYAYDGNGTILFESALDDFKLAGAEDYQHKCLNNLGCLYRETDPVKAEHLLSSALKISLKSNDTINMIHDLHSLMVLYYYQQQYDKALHYTQHVFRLNPAVDVSLYTSAANIYSRLGIIDSASLLLDAAFQADISNDEERLYLLESIGELALARGDSVNYLKYSSQHNHISDSLLANDKKMVISKAAKNYDKIKQQMTKESSLKKSWILCFLTVFAMIAIIILFVHHKKLKGYRRIIDELKEKSQEQKSTLNQLQHTIDNLEIDDEGINSFINMLLSLLRDVTEACYREPKSKLANHLSNILQFNDNNLDLWVGLYEYLDRVYNGIISKTHKNFPQLNSKDLLLIALNCLGFSYIQMAIILGYANATSIGPIKQRLANKMGLDCPLNEYISSFAQH